MTIDTLERRAANATVRRARRVVSSAGVMTHDGANLILEHLRAPRADNAEIRRRLGNLEVEVARLGKLVAVVIDGQQHIIARMAEFEARFERIERRLELRDDAPA